MEGFQGATLHAKLPYLDGWTAARRKIADRYHAALEDTPLRLPIDQADCHSAWHLYVVRHPDRDKLREHLEKRGIGTGLHYPLPLHLQACYRHLGYQPGAFPVAERAASECLSLPIYPELRDDQIDQVVAAIRDYFGAA